MSQASNSSSTTHASDDSIPGWFDPTFILTIVFVFTAAFFFFSDSRFGLKYQMAYGDTKLSEIASNYALAKLDHVAGSDYGDPELVSIRLIQGEDQYPKLEVEYRLGDERYEFEKNVHIHLAGESDVWIDMTEPEEIRASNEDYDDNAEDRLRNYAKDIKKSIDVAAESVLRHIKDRNEWPEVFSATTHPNAKSENT